MSVEVRVVRSSDIAKCPKMSLLPAHYREDGTCRCSERDQAEAEVRKAAREVKEARQRLDRAKAHLRST